MLASKQCCSGIPRAKLQGVLFERIQLGSTGAMLHQQNCIVIVCLDETQTTNRLLEDGSAVATT